MDGITTQKTDFKNPNRGREMMDERALNRVRTIYYDVKIYISCLQ